MRIAIITQYYPPETGAPQNRLSDLALRLKNNGHEVVVLTAMPNYPKNEIFEGYKNKIFLKESVSNIDVLRSWIYVGKSRSVISRLLNYFSFVVTSFFYGLIKLKKQDYILCESPPLFLGISGYFLSKIKSAHFIFNVSDLWPESAEKLGVITNKKILGIAEKLELWLYRKSYLITGQTQGIVKNIQSRTKQKKVHWLPNGLSPEIFDLKFETNRWRNQNNFRTDDFILSYVGILGHAQGLEVIINAAIKLREYRQIKFVLAGDGPELHMLKKLTLKNELENVFFAGPVSKTTALEIVYNSNAAVIPLRKIDLFKGAIPSKIFENLALKKPIILGVDGEAKILFIDDADGGVYFEPENATQLADAILKLESDRNFCLRLGSNGKLFVVKHFSRDQIALNFIQQLEKK